MSRIINNAQNRRLRAELQRITDSYIGDEAEKQIRLVADLSVRYPHSIQLLGKAIPGQPDTFRFNCHECTFDLRASEEVRRIAMGYSEIFPNRDYVAWLIDNVLREVSESEAQGGDFVVYFSNDDVTHSGLWRDGKVHSKWGLSHLWEHAIDEVPASYGDRVRFFRNIKRDQCVAGFVTYAETKITEVQWKKVGGL